jgi:hypothetical protein
MTGRGLPAYRDVVASPRTTSEPLEGLREELAGLRGKYADVEGQVAELRAGHRRQLRGDDHAARRAVAGAAEVLPLDEESLLARTRPLGGNIDPHALEARHDGQMRAALAGGLCAVIVLGGAHVSSAAVRRAAGGVAYGRVTTRRLREAVDGRADSH